MVLRWVACRLWGSVAAALLLTLQTVNAAATNQPASPIWTGVYAGVHGGYAWADVDYTLDLSFVPTETVSHSARDWFGGVHVGAQKQFGNTVVGVEVSYSGTHLTDTVESSVIDDRFHQIDIESLFLLTARLGYATDRWMAYVKGGYANAHVETRLFMAGGGLDSVTSGREGGWTVGAGLELLCWRNFRLGLEYNYVHLNIGGRSEILPDEQAFTYKRFDDDIHIVALRLSYLFGGYVRPLK